MDDLKEECNVDVFNLPVHPAADVFPMLDEDELVELSADIAENGLQQPIVVGEEDGVMMLVDGRNRREACARVSVEPEVRVLNGEDKTAFILSANINRRHLSKGQRAMAVAAICLETKQTAREAAAQNGLTAGRIGHARTVCQHAPELTPEVLSGAMPLDKAYAEARARKEAASSREARFARLKESVPDLADLVVEERMTLEDAEAAQRQRDSEAKAFRAANFRLFPTLVEISRLLSNENSRTSVCDSINQYPDEFYSVAGMSKDHIRNALASISDAAKLCDALLGGGK